MVLRTWVTRPGGSQQPRCLETSAWRASEAATNRPGDCALEMDLPALAQPPDDVTLMDS